jgi:hypothetical protein
LPGRKKQPHSQASERLARAVSPPFFTAFLMLSHLPLKLLLLSLQKLVLKQALTVALQWCLSHNFSVRLYALVALKKAWHLCKTLQFEECGAWTAVIECSLSQAESMHGAG